MREKMKNGQNMSRIKAAPNLVNICVDEITQEEIRGHLYHCYQKEAVVFKNVVELLEEMEKLYDKIHFPESSTESRSFLKKKPLERRTIVHQVVEPDAVLKQRGKSGTFFVCVQYRQNTTWQGEIILPEVEEMYEFSSALDLVKIINNTSVF